MLNIKNAFTAVAGLGFAALVAASPAIAAEITSESFSVPPGSRPHDVAPAIDGRVWYTGQNKGVMGLVDPKTGAVVEIPLGPGSRPHGVIVDAAGDAWITDGGQNAIVRVDGLTLAVDVFPLPADTGYANLNTAAFDGNGVLWFTGQSGIYGRFDPATEAMEVFSAPRGRGPYGITGTPGGGIYFASLAGSYVGKVDITTGDVTVLQPPTRNQGARRVWSDSQGNIWVAEWNAGQVAKYDPAADTWAEWKLPGSRPQAYAVFVDDHDIVWLTDFGANAIVRFDPATEEFQSFPSPRNRAQVRQLLGRPGEVWAPESGTNTLVVLRTGD